MISLVYGIKNSSSADLPLSGHFDRCPRRKQYHDNCILLDFACFSCYDRERNLPVTLQKRR
ncbi:hypothetical protein CLOSTHATH_01190 [Hungatella hathewayi DSM 13479]|uniref:Uncharacterized protein n=1 Tax=Hungatella hathewayi DSM 13479 TaxID=566550 RepID=D3AC62_9FIRM|nr:hypothetical protein CLOSTHATH_01190 [Hungatella hathewayi DSM 13479]